MRYTNVKTFKDYLASQQGERCRFYGVAVPDDCERKEFLDAVISYLPKALVVRYGEESSLERIDESLHDVTLFGEESIVVVDSLDKRSFENLTSRLSPNDRRGYLLVGAKGKTGFSFIEAHGVLLDLTDEKPWDREKRWLEQLRDKAKASGTSLSQGAASWMIAHLEENSTVLSREMDKLLCYCSHKSSIEQSDAEAICSAGRSRLVWTLADEIVWEKVFRPDKTDTKDSSVFYSLLAAIRQQLMIGAKMSDLRDRGVPVGEWGTHFPKMWPKTLEKRTQASQKLGSAYFRKGLSHLFDIELLARNGTFSFDLLTDLLALKLLHASRA